MFDLPPEALLNLGTHGTLLLVIGWLLHIIGRMQKRQEEIEDKLFALIDRTEVIAQHLDRLE